MTPKEKQFADEYLIDLNGTQAYKRAYGEDVADNTAAVEASKMIRKPNINAYIKERIKDRQKRTEVTQDKVVKELALIALGDVTDVVNVKQGRVVIQDTNELPDYIRRMIKSIKPSREGGVEVEFHDKIKALELLGRHMGMFDDKLSVESSQEEKVADILEGIMDAVDGETD